MNTIPRTVLAGWLLGLFVLSHPLAAEERQNPNWNYRIEVFADVAHAGFYHGNHSWGKGADFGGGAGVRPFAGRLRALGFEARTVRLSSQSGTPVSPSKLRASLLAASAVYHFRSGSRAQPYALGGAGVVNVDYFRSCNECIYNVDPASGKLTPIPWEERVRASKMGVIFGGGVKVAIHRRVSIRPEVLLVDTTPGSGWNWGWVRVQMGIGLHL